MFPSQQCVVLQFENWIPGIKITKMVILTKPRYHFTNKKKTLDYSQSMLTLEVNAQPTSITEPLMGIIHMGNRCPTISE